MTVTVTDKKYRLAIGYDYDCEDPISDDGLFKLHMFSSRLNNYSDPDALLGCRFESDDEDSDFFYGCGEMPTNHEGLGHDYDGPKGFFVSYFEHGMCKYGLAGTMDGMPDLRWDGVKFAGFLEVTAEGDLLEWWNDKSEDEREAIAAGTLETYTEWANGNCFWYQIESYKEVRCDQGGIHEIAEDVIDSCGGYIGDKWLAEALRDAMPEDMTEENTTVEDSTGGLANYLDLFGVKVKGLSGMV